MDFHGDPAAPNRVTAETTKDLDRLAWGMANSLSPFMRALDEANKVMRLLTGEGDVPERIDPTEFAKTMAGQWRHSFGVLFGDTPKEGTDGNSTD